VLTLTSIQAPNADLSQAAIARLLARALDSEVHFIGDTAWEERQQRLDAGQIAIGWICGLPYVQRADTPKPTFELLAAPVMASPRYGGHPIYFSDVVVRVESPYQTFADLRGARWAYNEPNSHSGYNITRYKLAQIGEPTGFFGQVVPGGSHEGCLRLLRAGRIDAAAIDSTVLETEARADPDFMSQLRLIESLGPSPIPPYVIHQSLPADLRQRVRGAFLALHEDLSAAAQLARYDIARFVAVEDAHYDPIRSMKQAADQAGVRL
jgi:phosphonate transport system substrate-binding protein